MRNKAKLKRVHTVLNKNVHKRKIVTPNDIQPRPRMRSDIKSCYIGISELERMRDNEKVDVNTNWLYWALAHSVKNKRYSSAKAIKKQIDKIDDCAQLYITMPVYEAKVCCAGTKGCHPTTLIKRYVED